MSTSRRPLGTGPRPDEPEPSAIDRPERARMAAERATAEPPAPSDEEQLPAQLPGRRRLGTGPEPDQSAPGGTQ
ncbi:hypothetical protein [Streptomyces sp. NPDC059455]|uniref:hypothetical protein n=1 Tax=Streptomyces sp. NPDC059455 TaxID=3346837 RepID=UPI0036C5B620